LAALYVAIARRNRPAWKPGVIELLACAEVTLAHALVEISPDISTKVFWYKMTYFGFAITPTAFLWLVLIYCGYGRMLTDRIRLLLMVVPVLNAVLIFTNELHGWLWNPDSTVRLVSSVSFLSVSEGRFWYWFYVTYAFCIMGLGCFFLGRLLLRSRGIYGWQAAAIVVAGLLAMLGCTLDIFGVSPLPSFSTTAIGLAVGSITVALMLSRFRRRDLMSVTRKAIFNSIGDVILVLDEDHCIVDINPAAESLMGITTTWAFGKPLERLSPEAKKIWNCIVNQSREVALHIKDVACVFDLRVSFVRDWRNRIVSQVVVLRDISERKRLENLVVQSEKLASLGTLSAGIAHEINSPLQVITGISESMLIQVERGELDIEQLKTRLATVNRNGWRIAAIVKSLLTYARANPEGMEIQDLNTIIQITERLMEHQFKTCMKVWKYRI
jgi:PAS domain S-box-containing protein